MGAAACAARALQNCCQHCLSVPLQSRISQSVSSISRACASVADVTQEVFSFQVESEEAVGPRVSKLLCVEDRWPSTYGPSTFSSSEVEALGFGASCRSLGIIDVDVVPSLDSGSFGFQDPTNAVGNVFLRDYLPRLKGLGFKGGENARHFQFRGQIQRSIPYLISTCSRFSTSTASILGEDQASDGGGLDGAEDRADIEEVVDQSSVGTSSRDLDIMELDNETVEEYLQSLGIKTEALEEMELPKSKVIVKERLDYLQNVIGLTIKDINDYPLMIGCSVRKNLSPVVQFLLTLKVTKCSLPVLIRKYPQVLHTSVAIDLIPNVRFIQGLGIELKQIGSVLTRYPQVLGFRIEGTMSTSIAYLVMIGVDKRQIGPLLTEKPEIMGMRVSNNIKAKVEFIVSCGIPHLVVGKMIENRPYILDYNVDDKMRPAVNALLALGVRKEALPQILVQYPEVLGMKVEEKVAAKLPWLTAKVGIPKESMAQILEKLPQILVINVPSGTKRVHALRNLGLTKDEVSEMIVTCPHLLGLSIEKRILPNAEFLVKEMKRDIKKILEFPAFLTYDLQSRIKPRYERVKDKGIDCPLAWMLNCSDLRFEDRLNEGYSKDMQEKLDVLFDTVGHLRVKG